MNAKIRYPISLVKAAAALSLLFCCTSAKAVVILGGTNNHNLSEALADLGVAFVDQSGPLTPNPAGLEKGDVIIIGNDGGTDPNPPRDYNAFLNAGGGVIMAGGSDWDPWRNWAAGYFNINDTAIGWHVDGKWHMTSNHVANQFLPANYTFVDNQVTYHMLAFQATPNTTLLGTNDEGNNVAAFRTYANGGSFNYMALDLGAYDSANNDQQPFITPWLRGALLAARVPEPSTVVLAIVAGGATWCWRKRFSV